MIQKVIKILPPFITHKIGYKITETNKYKKREDTLSFKQNFTD